MTDQPGVQHVDVTIPGPSLEDALLRVYLAGVGSGVISALRQMGMPEPIARHLAGHMTSDIAADPIPRSAAVNAATAAFHKDPSMYTGDTSIRLLPSGECGSGQGGS